MLNEQWKVIECDNGYLAVVTEGDVICVPDHNHAPRDAADAIRFRAISAVPDMLAALKQAESDQMAYVDRLYRDGSRMAESLAEARKRLDATRSAIAKAEGRANA